MNLYFYTRTVGSDYAWEVVEGRLPAPHICQEISRFDNRESVHADAFSSYFVLRSEGQVYVFVRGDNMSVPEGLRDLNGRAVALFVGCTLSEQAAATLTLSDLGSTLRRRVPGLKFAETAPMPLPISALWDGPAGGHPVGDQGRRLAVLTRAGLRERFARHLEREFDRVYFYDGQLRLLSASPVTDPNPPAAPLPAASPATPVNTGRIRPAAPVRPRPLSVLTEGLLATALLTGLWGLTALVERPELPLASALVSGQSGVRVTGLAGVEDLLVTLLAYLALRSVLRGRGLLALALAVGVNAGLLGLRGLLSGGS
ncbi:MAG: hypothetical protein Q4C89_06715 [Deinococcus sp.]|uniref:hypothetical protein n=1 Tax=Deinococcus sp. TaxID=47478 RepID=UPI0026DC3FE3|nr:hypothetical protein [Deinococcus sp.]MDO4245696.1 hypothetical protein [Deinococcus sp.]